LAAIDGDEAPSATAQGRAIQPPSACGPMTTSRRGVSAAQCEVRSVPIVDDGRLVDIVSSESEVSPPRGGPVIAGVDGSAASHAALLLAADLASRVATMYRGTLHPADIDKSDDNNG
jgi:hypothetical protein